MTQNTSSYVKNLPGAIALSFLCMFCVLLAGSLTSGIARVFFPLGYVLRFLVYAGLTFLIVRKLCSMSGLTMPECRITSFRLSFLSVFWAVLLPVFLFAAACMGSRGSWQMCSRLTKEHLENLFYSLFYTGICSGLVEEAAFRGYMLSLCERRLGKAGAFLVSTFFFVLPHVYGSGGDFTVLASRILLYVSLCSLFTLVTFHDNSIWGAVLIHASWDIFAAGDRIVSVSLEPETGVFFTYVLESEPYIMAASPAAGAFLGAAAVIFCCLVTAAVLKGRQKPDIRGKSSISS